MPANKKYLTKSIHQRIAKITAAILGGYILTMSLHLAAATWMDKTTVMITSTFTGFIMWVALMIVAFLARNGWKVWGLYLLLSALCAAVIYLGQNLNPSI
ncbi:hypothetical protein [Reichenbachiella ulvae]|uniref:DUF3649 domain-containing protein n=1 Tax=Reichenbachiella ulvae TaxID=2980104 RepID=A0ABT3CR32_9BACT|nr:hypothetical protein [Reichenbachiella ulvae]MCV9386127.1 hypothetical protein [Reichenbachiella ulvae]